MDSRTPALIEVRVAMLRRGWSVKETARRIDRSRTYLSGCLSGWYPMSKPLARDLADVLGLDLALLRPDDQVEAAA